MMTKRRLTRTFIVTFLAAFLITASSTTYNDCFKTYMDSSKYASNVFVASYEQCMEMKSQQELLYSQKTQTDMENLKNAGDSVCDQIQNCNALDGHQDFFSCHAAAGSTIMETMLTMQRNSTELIASMQNENNVAEKERVLCTLAAKTTYQDTILKGFEEFTNCLKEL